MAPRISTTTITEGWTAKLPFTLTADGTALNGTGFTLSACVVTGNDDTEVSTVGKFNWTSAASGTVYYKPGASDLLASKSPYRIKFEVTDGAGDIVYFPNGDANEIVVKAARR
jgi:hypothetical protein